MRLFFLVTFLYSLSVVAQSTGADFDSDDVSQSDPYMDYYYQRGRFLLYDCIKRHWVCTRKFEYKNCENQRKKAMLEYKTNLPCAHFDVFRKSKDCRKRQQELTDRALFEQFCFHPAKSKDRIDF